MDMWIVILLAVNLVVLVVLLVLLILRTRADGAANGLRQLGSELRQDFATQRGELTQSLTLGQQQLDARLQAVATAQTEELAREREARIAAQTEQRELLERTLTGLMDRMHANQKSAAESQTQLQEAVRTELGKQQQTMREELEKMRQGNEAKLEKMRETVDEKLQGTLEKRLGESFSLVSERLEQVQRGLGEMQTLASDVGGLKRVLTNVKSRGGWGEVQLARQLEDVLTPDQYSENVATLPGSSERVEFAVKLPGAGDGEPPVWLPIDSKFPQEDYERLLAAQEAGDAAAIETAGRDIERAVLAQAKNIASKYVEAPHTTDFGIMYLPTEGLFAEIMRRPGFTSRLQNEHRIIVVGPTTLTALLTSLQMGFRTLAIEKRSSEVWKVLSAAKTEFQKYGDVWDRVGKQLKTVQNTVSEAGRRTRAVERKLRDVETFELADSTSSSPQAALEDVLFDDESESSEE